MKKMLIKGVAAAVRDAAFQFRMGAGYPGDVNRTHPASISPELQCVLTPSTAYGQAVVADTAGATNTVRPFGAGDAALTVLWGITVRPFPTQQAASASLGAPASFGAATPPATGPIDVLRAGYIMVQLNPGQASPKKGDAVLVQTQATVSTSLQGGFMTAATYTCATLDARYKYNGPADSSGVVEVCCNV